MNTPSTGLTHRGRKLAQKFGCPQAGKAGKINKGCATKLRYQGLIGKLREEQAKDQAAVRVRYTYKSKIRLPGAPYRGTWIKEEHTLEFLQKLQGDTTRQFPSASIFPPQDYQGQAKGKALTLHPCSTRSPLACQKWSSYDIWLSATGIWGRLVYAIGAPFFLHTTMRTPTTAVAVLAATAVGAWGLAESRAFIALTTSRQTAAPGGTSRGEHHYRRRRCSSTSPLPPRAVRQEEEDGEDNQDEDDQQIFWDAVVEVSCCDRNTPKVCPAQRLLCYAVLCCAVWFRSQPVLHDDYAR